MIHLSRIIFQRHWPAWILIAGLFGCGSNQKLRIPADRRNAVQPSYPSVRIAVGNKGELGPCEPSLVINPAHPANLVAGSVLNYLHVSQDSGKTWTSSRLTSELGVYGDPCLLASPQGDIYYFHLGDPENLGWKSPRLLESLVCQHSIDRGQTFSTGAGIGTNPPKDQDKPWAYVDPATGNIYVSWTEFDLYGSQDTSCKSRIRFSVSTDRGKTWEKPRSISTQEGNCLDNDDTTEGAVPVSGPDGKVWVSWAYQGHIYLNRSRDQGATWEKKSRKILDMPEGWAYSVSGIGRCNGMPVLARDAGKGPFAGRLYICWADLRNGAENSDVFLSWSDDEGDTWTRPRRVNRDKNRRHQFFPWISVDPVNGHVAIVYYDREQTQDNDSDVTVALSKQGGKSFNYIRANSEIIKAPRSREFFGDYNNISAYGGMIRPIWTGYDGDRLSVWTCLINLP